MSPLPEPVEKRKSLPRPVADKMMKSPQEQRFEERVRVKGEIMADAKARARGDLTEAERKGEKLAWADDPDAEWNHPENPAVWEG